MAIADPEGWGLASQRPGSYRTRVSRAGLEAGARVAAPSAGSRLTPIVSRLLWALPPLGCIWSVGKGTVAQEHADTAVTAGERTRVSLF